MAHDRHDQAAGVCVAMPICTRAMLAQMPASSSNIAFSLGDVGDRPDHARIRNGSRVSLARRPVARAFSVARSSSSAVTSTSST